MDIEKPVYYTCSKMEVALCKGIGYLYFSRIYGIAAIGATVVGGLLAGTVSGIPIKLAISFGMSVLTATASLPMIAVAVAFQKKPHFTDFVFCYLCSYQFCFFCYDVVKFQPH